MFFFIDLSFEAHILQFLNQDIKGPKFFQEFSEFLYDFYY